MRYTRRRRKKSPSVCYEHWQAGGAAHAQWVCREKAFSFTRASYLRTRISPDWFNRQAVEIDEWPTSRVSEPIHHFESRLLWKVQLCSEWRKLEAMFGVSTSMVLQPEHKPICEELRRANNGNLLNKPNPVLRLARGVTMNEDLLKAIEFILISNLNLANGDLSLARKSSVNIWARVVPVEGHTAKDGKQKMALQIVSTQTIPFIEQHHREMLMREKSEMSRKGMEVDQMISANFIWVPVGDPTSLNYNARWITPEKIAAFKEFRLARIRDGTIRAGDRSAEPFIKNSFVHPSPRSLGRRSSRFRSYTEAVAECQWRFSFWKIAENVPITIGWDDNGLSIHESISAVLVAAAFLMRRRWSRCDVIL
ncbi:hypothetical protein D9757_011298 [Collybiopsis confluens]|uniref:Uncharacterized protein n=1 Tax=Collybiopsis confluens TaxID=2823264 RepID=A0A8H5GNG4_9AGAR|nr:hypothetical protein D9757_011298 [Collybiopsis confluens]